MDVLKAAKKLDRYFEAYLALGVLTVYSIIIILDTLRRVIVGQQTLWGHEIVIAMFIWMSWISAAYVVRWNGHLRFTFFLRDFSNNQKGVVAIIESFAWIMFAGIVMWYSISVFDTFAASGRTFTGTDIPSSLSYLSIPVCFSLILVRGIQRLYISARNIYLDEEIKFEMEDAS